MPQTIFENLNFRFDTLRKSADLFQVKDRLTMAQTIRNEISNDSELDELCNNDNFQQRAELLDSINRYITEQILSVIEIPKKENIVNKYKIDNFDEARLNLSKLAKQEKAKFNDCLFFQETDCIAIPNIEVHLCTINNTIENCDGNRYEILLLGEYQSGKTTTLNAFCGGQYIGAIGRGTKTSAVPISVSYGEKISIKVLWKSEEDLINGFYHISPYFPSLDLSHFDLSDDNERKDLLGEIENLRTNYNIEKIGESDLQYMAICSVIVHYWPTLVTDIRNKEYTVGEIASISRFPDKFIKRWLKSGPTAFKQTEILFLYIKYVECKCPSPILQEMNCSIIDSPGLFASKYDTSVTEAAMLKADAILYILPRERQLGHQIDESLSKIKNLYPDHHKKLIIANNLSFLEANSTAIFDSNSDIINQSFGEESKLIPYDALLSYLGEIKESYDNHLLTEETIANFIKSTPPQFSDFISGTRSIINNFNDAWKSRTEEISWKYRKDISAEELVRIGRFDNLIESINLFVERNRAYSTIIANGAGKLRNELEEIRMSLIQSFVEPYLRDRNDLVYLWDQRIKNSDSFNEKAKIIVNDCLFGVKDDGQSLSDIISDKVYEKLFPLDFYNALISDICDAIYDDIHTIKKLKKKETELKEFMKELVTRCITNKISNRINDYWNPLVQSNQDETFNSVFTPQISIMEMKIDSLWKEVFHGDNSFVNLRHKYYQIPNNTQSILIKQSQQSSTVSVNYKYLNVAIALDYAAISTFISGCVAGLALSLAVCVGSGPIGWLLLAVGTVIGGGYLSDKIEDFNREKFHKKMEPELRTQIISNDSPNNLPIALKEMVSKQIKALLESYSGLLTLNLDLIKRDMDLAISSYDNPSKELHCNQAIGIIECVNDLILQYSDFISKFSENENN